MEIKFKAIVENEACARNVVASFILLLKKQQFCDIITLYPRSQKEFLPNELFQKSYRYMRVNGGVCRIAIFLKKIYGFYTSKLR